MFIIEEMKVIFIGDIFGKPARKALKTFIPKIKEQFSPDFIIANGENAAHGAGITDRVADELFSFGIDVLTGGNHSFDKRAIWDKWGDFPFLLRPANFPEGSPGKGYACIEKNHHNLCVVNLQGRVGLAPTLSPFDVLDKIVKEVSEKTKNIIVDFHAEATSEKKAFGFYADGKVSAVIGTHTHVQTADAKILPGGTAYITDCGMCGVADSVIGLDREVALKRFITLLPYGFKVAEGTVRIDFVFLDIEHNGRAKEIRAFSWTEED